MVLGLAPHAARWCITRRFCHAPVQCATVFCPDYVLSSTSANASSESFSAKETLQRVPASAMNTLTTSRLSKLLLITSGSLAAAPGLMVVVSWHAHNEALIHVRPGFVTPGMDEFELTRKIKSDPDIASVNPVTLTSFGCGLSKGEEIRC
jgi:hypothetical protein